MRPIESALNRAAHRLAQREYARLHRELSRYVDEEKLRGATTAEIIANLAVYDPAEAVEAADR